MRVNLVIELWGEWQKPQPTLTKKKRKGNNPSHFCDGKCFVFRWGLTQRFRTIPPQCRFCSVPFQGAVWGSGVINTGCPALVPSYTPHWLVKCTSLFLVIPKKGEIKFLFSEAPVNAHTCVHVHTHTYTLWKSRELSWMELNDLIAAWAKSIWCRAKVKFEIVIRSGRNNDGVKIISAHNKLF